MMVSTVLFYLVSYLISVMIQKVLIAIVYETRKMILEHLTRLKAGPIG